MKPTHIIRIRRAAAIAIPAVLGILADTVLAAPAAEERSAESRTLTQNFWGFDAYRQRRLREMEQSRREREAQREADREQRDAQRRQAREDVLERERQYREELRRRHPDLERHRRRYAQELERRRQDAERRRLERWQNDDAALGGQ